MTLFLVIKRSPLMLFITGLLSIAASSQAPSGNEFIADNPLALTVQKVVQEVDVIFTVTDRHGHLVRNLTQKDIAIYDNGEAPAQINYFGAHTRLPLRLALVIDTSDSVRGSIPYEEAGAEDLLRSLLRPRSDVALVMGFNERTYLAEPTTADVHALTRAIRNLPTGGNTAIYDAVAFASTELERIPNTPPSLRAVIVMTDGDDNASRLSLEETAEIAQQNETAVYALNTGTKSLRTDKAEKNMRELAEASGGKYFLADEDHIRAVLYEVKKDLQSQYAIGYKPASAAPDGSFHKISILVPKKLRAHHRQGYFAR